jgi:hypothetical protein
MRILILGLVLANLAFFGWAHWIAAEPVPRPDATQAAVPLLKLAREVAPPEPPPGAPTAAPEAAREPAAPAAPDAGPESASAPPVAPPVVAPAGVATR